MRALGPDAEPRWVLRNGAHLAALSAFAFAQPIFDILGRNPEFFAVRRSSATEIVVFALAVTFAIPALLLTIECAASLVSGTIRRALHLFFVGSLTAVALLHVTTRTESMSGQAALALAAVGGAAFAALYLQAGIARSLVTVLAPIPFVVVALFLFGSPVWELVNVDTPVVEAATVETRTPVVLVVFDELSTSSLMDRWERIDARRFPGFASLARDATWYRNTSTVHWLSEGAVPAILTGSAPTPGRLPVYSAYPRNLFTLLGGRYQMRVIETLTSLCPGTLCKDGPQPGPRSRVVGDSVGQLASDVGIVYLHQVLPEPYSQRLPSIDEAWGNFAQGGEAEETTARRAVSGGILPCGRRVCDFTDVIEADRGKRRPALYFLHAPLPHTPYVYLPSGKRYAVDLRTLRGRDPSGRWSDEFAALQSNQRYLLQLGYTDKALHLILRTLRRAGLYDRSLVVVTADHGVSFRLGGQRRGPTPANLDDVGFVPLLVKLPGQRNGRIVDSFARIVDILPTIAHELGIRVPWPVEGRPLRPAEEPSDGTVSVMYLDGSRVEAPVASLRAQRSRHLRAQAATFGSGSLDAVYRIGPHRELVGRAVSTLRVRVGAEGRVELVDAALLSAVDPNAEILPSYVEGSLGELGEGGVDLAVAVNGRVAAVARSFRQGARTKFSAFVPERSLRAGPNVVRVFVVVRDQSGLVLEELRERVVDLTLRTRDEVLTIHSPRAGTLHVYPKALRGDVSVGLGGTGAAFSGHAFKPNGQARVRFIAVFVGNRSVYVGSVGSLRPHRVLGQQSLGRFGFAFELPRSLLPATGAGQSVRVFAIRGRLASELRYAHGYPWRRR